MLRQQQLLSQNHSNHIFLHIRINMGWLVKTWIMEEHAVFGTLACWTIPFNVVYLTDWTCLTLRQVFLPLFIHFQHYRILFCIPSFPLPVFSALFPKLAPEMDWERLLLCNVQNNNKRTNAVLACINAVRLSVPNAKLVAVLNVQV